MSYSLTHYKQPVYNIHKHTIGRYIQKYILFNYNFISLNMFLVIANNNNNYKESSVRNSISLFFIF